MSVDEVARQRAHSASRDAVALITALANEDSDLGADLAEQLKHPFATAYVACSLAAGFVQEKAESTGVPLAELLEHLGYRIETLEIP